jgi:hypothetical protein
MEYKVPRILWENLESVLLTQSRKYVCELARYLKVPEKELLNKVLPSSDSLNVIIQDSNADTNKCKAYIQMDSMTVLCKKPVAFHSEYCTIHRMKRMNVEDNSNVIEVERIKDIAEYEPIWLVNNTIVNSKGETIGKRTTNKIKLYTI